MLIFVKTIKFQILMFFLASSAVFASKVPYYYTQLELSKAWQITTGSEEISVAVISSGIDYKNHDLVSSIKRDEDGSLGHNAINNSSNVRDKYGFGTESASVITSRIVGISKKVKIIPISVLSEYGSTNSETLSIAIRYAVKRKANIIVMAIGGGSSSEPMYCRELEKASDQGSLIFVSPGNSGMELPETIYPANCNVENMIVVASTTKMRRLAPHASFSAEKVHVGSPAEQINVIGIGGRKIKRSGGTYATYLAAGVGALLWSENLDYTASMIKNIIMETVTKVPALNRKVKSGGIINAYKALTYNK